MIKSHLDGGLVRGEAVQRLRSSGLPDVEQVIVAAGRQLRAAGRPLEAAHLLRVRRQPPLHVLLDPA